MIEIAKAECCQNCESFVNGFCTMPKEVYGEEKPIPTVPEGMCEMFTERKTDEDTTQTDNRRTEKGNMQKRQRVSLQ